MAIPEAPSLNIRFIFASICYINEWENARAMERCWATSLGDCEGQITLEHYVSKCIFPDREVMVKGFPWCKDQAKPIRIETLGRNMLCKKHNIALSPLDASMPIMFGTLEKSAELLDRRRDKLCRTWPFRRFTLDGNLLERWCLKTLLNISYRRELEINHSSGILALPMDELVRIAFRRSKFKEPAGLYVQGRVNENISLRRGIQIRTIISDTGELVGGGFDLFGYPFVLSILPEAVATTDGSELLHRNVRMIFQTKDDRSLDVVSHSLDIKYR